MSSSSLSLSLLLRLLCPLLAALLLPLSVRCAVVDVSELFASASSAFSSHKHISEVHLLEDFHVLAGGQPLPHFHPMSSQRHSFRTFDASDPSAIPSYSWIPSPHSQRTPTGHVQPFPSSIDLRFSAFNSSFHLPMRLVPDVFTSNASIEVWNGDGELLDIPPPSHSVYWHMTGSQMDDDWSVAVLREDGRFHLLFSQEGEVFQADPMEHFRQEMDSSVFHTMATSSERGMAIYRHKDLINHGEKKCANTDEHDHRNPHEHEHAASSSSTSDLQPAFGAKLPSSPSLLRRGVNGSSSPDVRRRLLQTQVNDEQPTLSNEATMTPFSIFTTPQRLSLSIVVDAGFYSLFGNVADVQMGVLSVIAYSNVPLLKQLQSFVTVTSLAIYTTPDTTGLNPWNRGSYSTSVIPHACPNYDINQQLADMYNYRANYHPEEGGAHHLFTNCWPAPGMVGISYIGWICWPDYAISISSYNTPFWQTVVHEIGHTFGAQHTLGLGGIMDYYIDSRYPIGTGPYQFHPDNQAQLQENLGIVSLLADPNTAPYCNINYQTMCGNGVVEPGEACDDNSACCTSTCQLATNAQCSGGGSCCSAQCKFVPSTTLCAGGEGVCVNGQCEQSSCPTNLPFCGMDASTGSCRQSCASGAFCYSGWSYNLNLADGTSCNTNGGTCQSGTCVTPSSGPVGGLVFYTWTMSDWPAACPCNGVENRTVTCVGSDGLVYPNNHCAATTMPATSQTCTVPTACWPYQWQYSAFTSCSQSCDGGVQSRTATCYWMSTPAVLAPGMCNSIAQQPLTQQCNAQACTYQYNIASTWGSCSASCAGGTQSRSSPTTCSRSINGAWQQMPLSSCAAVLGYTVSDTQSCNTQACDVYGWSYGSWGSCSAACASGLQTRSATCMDFTTNRVAGSGNCTATAVTSQTCNAQLCPSFSWQYGSWSSCSVTCGSGTQTRAATCYDSVYNQVYPASTCNAAIGSAVVSQSCSLPACYQGNYQWQFSAWGSCPVSCGGGNQTRQVACVDLNQYVLVNNALCDPTTIPASYQACGQKTCDIFTWSVTSWGTCSATCGGGTQTRGVYCQNFWTHVLSAPSTCLAYMTSAQPSSSQSCNTQPCPSAIRGGPLDGDEGWTVGEWGSCSVTCGGGVQTREVSCSNSTLCGLTSQPSSSSACNTQSCPTFWSVGAWSSCSASCSGGSMTRNVTCMQDIDGVVAQVPSEQCTETAPSVNGNCNFFPCPTWQYSDWSSCSAQCGYGVQQRTATCTKYDGTALAASQCSAMEQDTLSQPCQNNPCPHWHRSAWGDCSLPCGGGNQTRQVSCRMPHDAIFEGLPVSTSLCPTSGADIGGDGPGAAEEPLDQVPATSRQCNPQQCPAFYWTFVPTSACSVACGGGFQQGSFACVNGSTHAEVPHRHCSAEEQPDVPMCNAAACSDYSWKASAFSACNATCGSGVQTRNVSCVSLAGVAVDDTNCDDALLPAVEQACSVDESVCYGSEQGGINGICVASACQCRPGWTGLTCDGAPFIVSVDSGASSFTDGVPMGESILVSWSDSGSLPYVSILLLKVGSAEWPVGQYIAQHLVNYGGYEWTVGSLLSDLDAGNYSVRVWFSDDVYADSAPFAVADPCGYVACGDHGQCSRGVCQCQPGFSGSDCSLGPCDSKKCNWAHALQCNDLDWFTYDHQGAVSGAVDMQCQCTDGWTGPLCATPPMCSSELVCLNGADTNLATLFVDWTNTTSAHSCGSCKCSGHYVGADCGTCPITCANGGVPDANCTSCVCPANSGFYGSSCQNRYYDLNVTLSNVQDTAGLTTDMVTLARFERTAATDFAIAAGVSTLSGKVSVAIRNLTVVGPAAVQMAVRFGLGAALASSYDFGGSLMDASEDGAFSISATASSIESASLLALARQAMLAGQKIPRDLPTAWTMFAAALSSLDSQLYQGVVTGSIDPTVQVTVVDPSGQDQPVQPSLPRSIFVRAHAAPSRAASSTAAAQVSPVQGAAGSSTSLAAWSVVVLLPVLLVALAYMAYRYRQSLRTPIAFVSDAPLAFDFQLPPAPPTTTAPPFPRLPSASDLEMVSSAHSEDAMEYLQRSISDSSVAYQLHRGPSSPTHYHPHPHSLMRSDSLEQLPMRRSDSFFDSLPTPPTLSPAVSSA